MMGLADALFTIGFFGIPPLLLIAVGIRLRTFVYSVGLLWLLLVVSGQFHLAFTPDYDSFAPRLVLVFGWLPAAVYSGLCMFIAYGMSRPANSKN